MSKSDETFDKKFDEFFSHLHSMQATEKLTKLDLGQIIDALFVAPEMIADYLTTCSRLAEIRATIEARTDHKQQVLTPLAGQKSANRTELVHAYRALYPLWRGVLATCEDHEQIPELVRKYLARRV